MGISTTIPHLDLIKMPGAFKVSPRCRDTTQNSKMFKMQVYAVIGGYEYDGSEFDTLRLFDCKSAADAYREELENEYDYALMELREVCMESAIVA